MAPFLIILLVGLVYLLSFGMLSFLRRQGLSVRFAVEGLIVTGIGSGLVYLAVPLHPLIFLLFLYLVTMRGRLLVDIANQFTSMGKHKMALALTQLTLRLKIDTTTRRIVLINHGHTLLRMGKTNEAYKTLKEALRGVGEDHFGAKYLAAGYYNSGLACQRTGREAEAVNNFKKAIDAWPRSIYGEAAERELEKSKFK